MTLILSESGGSGYGESDKRTGKTKAGHRGSPLARILVAHYGQGAHNVPLFLLASLASVGAHVSFQEELAPQVGISGVFV